MGFFEWLGISPRDAPKVEDSVRDSGQTFVFGKADSGETVNEKSAMQIATVYACVRLLAESVAGLPLTFTVTRTAAEGTRNGRLTIRCISCCTASRTRR